MGRVTYYDAAEVLRDPASTPPHQWKDAASTAWASLVIGYMGPAAARRFDGLVLSAEGIRTDYGGIWDESKAQEISAHYWPDEHRETVLNASAILAGMLVSVPRVWDAIESLSAYLIENARHRVGTGEMETLVRRFIPVSVVCPETEWATALSV